MPLALYFGPPVYAQPLGLATAEVYRSQGVYRVFIVGDTLASFLGSSASLEDCKEEIRSLQLLVDSEVFASEAGKHC